MIYATARCYGGRRGEGKGKEGEEGKRGEREGGMTQGRPEREEIIIEGNKGEICEGRKIRVKSRRNKELDGRGDGGLEREWRKEGRGMYNKRRKREKEDGKKTNGKHDERGEKREIKRKQRV